MASWSKFILDYNLKYNLKYNVFVRNTSDHWKTSWLRNLAKKINKKL